ncbi:MAG: phosphoenolpyruvate carboxykinase (GTP) [Candidatus Micrarchaeia archaeon]
MMTSRGLFQNEDVDKEVGDIVELLNPKKVTMLHGKPEEYEMLVSKLLGEGRLIKLNETTYPNCYLARSDPNDVARTEQNTYICTDSKEDAGPTNNWLDRREAKEMLFKLIANASTGKELYVLPYVLGPNGSEYSQVGIEITDSAYVAANQMIIALVGDAAIERLEKGEEHVLGIHQTMQLDPNKRYIAHFPKERLIISVNTDYGGNALLSKKCHALRIASAIAKEKGFMTEHMMAIEVTTPEGKSYGISGAFPSSSGKTNLAMINPPEDFKGWKVRLLSDDIIWLFEHGGGVNAINPEYGFFGVAPGTNDKTNPNAMRSINSNTIFTNVALTTEMEPWWEGLGEPPQGLIDWQGRSYDPKNGPAAHPNSRFTTPIRQYPYLSDKYTAVEGMKINAMLFGGRRTTLVPLVFEAYNWAHGVLLGAMLRAETTAAVVGKIGVVRNDPMAMRPFCGYNMADYFAHWLKMGEQIRDKPKIYMINWFRKDENGKYIWPGFGENMRVLKWIIERTSGSARDAVETPIGMMPSIESFDYGKISREQAEKLLYVDKEGWLKELEEVKPFLESFGERMPRELWGEFYKLKERLEE